MVTSKIERGDRQKLAIEAFLEECHEMGILTEVIEEAGFLKIENTWQSRRPITEENIVFAV